MGTKYLAIDGDDVGRRLEYFTLTNNVSELSNFSDTFQSGISHLEQSLLYDLHAEIIFSGGDNLLVSIPSEYCSIEVIEEIRVIFSQNTSSTLSMGVGDSPREAYFALKIAKASGKNRLCQFNEVD